MLAQFLQERAAMGFNYGASDCATLMADWLVRCGYPDPMADRRGNYATRVEYRRAIKSEGGFRASCAARFGRIGLGVASEASTGDVALVWAPFAKRHGRILWTPTGALCVTETLRVVMTTDMGLMIAPLRTLLAWKVT